MLNRDYSKVLAVLIVAVCGLTSCVAKKTDTQSATADIPRIAFEKYTLPNGLQVILQRGASSGIRRLSAGDFGGKLGRHHFRLHQILA